MKLIPMPQSVTKQSGTCNRRGLYLGETPSILPPFVKDSLRVLCNEAGDVVLRVNCGDNTAAEGYSLRIEEHAITVTAEGYKGVYYAAKTLAQLCESGDVLPCVVIEDAPDLAYRGFYQDVSRGRIPTLATLKRLVDRLSALKMNSLQLYVEHTHRFAEYVGINDDLGYYTDDEIRELDTYCREHCVELIPSLSSFGHLYYLLESPRYHHLCEIPDHKPTQHNWHDRLIHHTIDPSEDESFALITSLMAQYMPLFSSTYFNICCDETFDLCKGKNAGGDVAATYAGFVLKLADFLKAHGKTVMMWGDIVLQHPETVSQLPDDIVFLNWCYDMSGNGLKPEVFAENGKTQIVCPSVHSHKRFVEKIVYSVPNIQAVIEQGYAHGAKGVLCTNWGDYGHVCPDEAMLYSMAFCAAKAWNVNGTAMQAFEQAALPLVYRTTRRDVIGILQTLGECDEIWFQPENYEMALWELTVQFFDRTNGIPATYERRMEVLRGTDLAAKAAAACACAVQLQDLMDANDLDPVIGRALILSARAIAAVFTLLEAVSRGKIDAAVTELVTDWLAEYRAMWFEDNKAGEWSTIETFFADCLKVC